MLRSLLRPLPPPSFLATKPLFYGIVSQRLWSSRPKFYSTETPSRNPLPPTLLNPTLQRTLSQKSARYKALLQTLNSSATLTSDALSTTSKELSELEDTHHTYTEWLKVRGDLAELFQLLQTSRDEIAMEADMLDLTREEYAQLTDRIGQLERDIIAALLPKDSADEGSAILEIRAGTGGDEAALFAADVMKMYERFAQLMRWKWEMMQMAEDSNKGIKDATVNIAGKNVFGTLKYESGVHRVQRVPATESQGRIHTSTVTIAILPQPTEVDVQIRDSDLRIDVYRSSGAGGQHVNTTDSAVRITHLPTGLAVAMQDERSQHKNKAKALKLLRAKLYEQEREKVVTERRDSRNKQIGSGDRSEKIRTYNFPQNRVTDHRINLTLYELELVLSGQNLNNIVDQLKFHYDTEALAELV